MDKKASFKANSFSSPRDLSKRRRQNEKALEVEETTIGVFWIIIVIIGAAIIIGLQYLELSEGMSLLISAILIILLIFIGFFVSKGNKKI